MYIHVVQWNLSIVVTIGAKFFGCYRRTGGCFNEIEYHTLLLIRRRISGWYRQVAALHSDHNRQVPLYYMQLMHLRAYKMGQFI